MSPVKASLYKTARIREDAAAPHGFTPGQYVTVRYLGIGDQDEPVYAISARDRAETLIEASQLEGFVL